VTDPTTLPPDQLRAWLDLCASRLAIVRIARRLLIARGAQAPCPTWGALALALELNEQLESRFNESRSC
jgi:hypothetical protein